MTEIFVEEERILLSKQKDYIDFVLSEIKKKAFASTISRSVTYL